MDQSTALKSAKQYADIIRSTMDTRQIFLFGSYAKGVANKDSDIDIAVLVDHMPSDYLSTLTLLWQATYDVNNSIEPILLVAGDSRGGLLQEVLKTGITI